MSSNQNYSISRPQFFNSKGNGEQLTLSGTSGQNSLHVSAGIAQLNGGVGGTTAASGGTTGVIALTRAANLGKTTIILATTGAVTYQIPQPQAAGEHYHLVSASGAVMAHNVIIQALGTTGAADDSVFYVGSLTHLDTNADNLEVYSNGSSNSKITQPAAFKINIHLVSKSTTEWYLWGTIVAAAPPNISDA